MAPRKKKIDWSARYHDLKAPGSLGGVQRFARAHKIPLKKAKDLLQQDLGYTLHKPRRRRFPTIPVVVGGLDDQWVADLVEVQPLAKWNGGIRYLLTMVDGLSKYAWVQPLKNRMGSALVQAFDTILKQGCHPNRLQMDGGKEFYNKPFQSWLKEKDIHHFSTQGNAKAALEERFNRTFKERLYRYFATANTLKFEDVLQDLVQGYNATPHRSIGMAPQDVTWKHLYGKPTKHTKAKFKVGDRVRLNKIHRTFKKSYFTWLDQRSVCCTSCEPWRHPYLQDTRMG